jgi:ABC-type transporter Mla maintaining outer membrane lipid asymmetry ATPase subunit MlaF
VLAPAGSDRDSRETNGHPQEKPILQVENVNKSFRRQHVLKDLNLEIAKGEFLTLLGPSGVATAPRSILSPAC